MAGDKPSELAELQMQVNASDLPQLGEEISGFAPVAAPESCRDHPLVAGKLFYALPPDLLDRVLRFIPEEKFDPQLFVLERAMTHVCSPPTIGFWNGRMLQSHRLAPLPPLTTMDLSGMEQLGWSKEFQLGLKANLAQADVKLRSAQSLLAGYLGWLLTEKTFLEEHDALLGRHADFIRGNGLPQMATVGRAMASSSLKQLGFGADDDRASDAFDQFEKFYVRWRLQGLDGPYAPNPLTPQLPVYHFPGLFGHMREGGQTFYLPDIYPVPSRDELRQLIEENLRPSHALPGHLTSWQGLVSADRSERNQIQRYARLYPLQHAVRILYARHGSALKRSKGQLQAALGEHFGVSADAIKDDMALIAERLGSGWEEAPRVI